jgi:putative DNA primase/helicase
LVRFLTELFGQDHQAITALQDWFGYMLSPDTSQHKIFFIVGPRRSGKGTIARVQTALVGRDSVANPTLASLQTNFGIAPLIGKPVAIITDARLGGRSDQAAITERLLSISGEDALTIDRKHIDA